MCDFFSFPFCLVKVIFLGCLLSLVHSFAAPLDFIFGSEMRKEILPEALDPTHGYSFYYFNDVFSIVFD